MSAAAVENNASATGGVTGKGFQPGQSGNPGGRPKGLARKVRELVGDDGQALLEFMIAVATGEYAQATTKERMDAVAWLTDRGWGKAANFAAIEEADPLGYADVERAKETVAEQLDELAKRRAAG